MLKLSEYTEMAEKLIFAYMKRHGKFIITDDLVGLVIRYMAFADHKWNPEKSFAESGRSLTKIKYRRMRGIYAIREYLKPKRIIPFSNFLLSNKDESLHPEHSKALIRKLSFYDNTIEDENDKKNSRKLDFLMQNASLTPSQKQIIYMYRQGYKPRHIAEEIKTPVQKVYRELEQSIKQMRRIAKNA